MEKEIDLKIVVVDDSDFARESIVEILESGGHKVLAQADSADKALEVAKSLKANLYIIDVVMPGTSGLQICEKILEFQPNTAIIITSSLKSESIIIDSIVAGAIDFLQKPFKREDLLKSCQRAKKLLARR